MDEQENLLYFDKDDRLTYRGNGTPKRLSGTGDTEGKAKSAYRAKCVAILQAGYYMKTRSKTTQELIREIPTVTSPHDGRVYLSPSNPDGVCYYLIEWLKKNKKPGIHVKPKTFDHYMEIAERLYRFFGETDAAVINRDCMQEFFEPLPRGKTIRIWGCQPKRSTIRMLCYRSFLKITSESIS